MARTLPTVAPYETGKRPAVDTKNNNDAATTKVDALLATNDEATEKFFESMASYFEEKLKSIAHTMIVSSNLPPDAWDVILAESQGNFADCQSPVKKKLKSNSPVVVALPRATVAAAASLPPPPPLPDAYLHHGLSNRELGRIRGLKKNDLIAELDSMGGDYLKSWTKAHLVDALLEAYAAHNCPLAETQVATTKYDEFLGNNDVEMMQDVSVSETENKKKPNEAQPSSKGSSKHSAVSRPKHHHITKSNDGSFRKAQPLRQQGMVKRAIAAKEKQATAAKCVVARGATAAAQPKDIVDDGNDCMSITSLADETDKPDAPSAVVAVELAKAAKEKPVAKGVVARGAVAAAEPKRIIGDDKRMSSISLAATDKLEALSIVVDDDDDDATKPHVVENDRDSTAMEIDEPVAAQTSAAVDAPDDEYDESEDEEFFTAPQSGSQGSQLFSQKPVAVQKYVSKLTPIKGSAVKPPRSSPSAVPRGFVHSITKQLQASQTKQPPPQPVMFPSLHGRDGYGNEREPHLTDELEYAKKQMANNRLLLTPAFSGNLLSGAKPGGSEVLKAFSEARMKRAAEIKAASQNAPSSTLGKTAVLSSATKMIIPAGPVSDTNAPMSSKDRLKAEMRTKHQLRAQMAPPVRPVAAPSPPVSVAALMTSKMTPPPPSDKKPSAKKTPASGEFVNYEMTDSEYDSDDDDRSETSKPAKRIPDWARSHNLLKALERQYSPNYPIDPDELFGEVESCNLEAIFGKKSSKYRRRNSSGDWTKDKVTSEEKRKYKLALL